MNNDLEDVLTPAQKWLRLYYPNEKLDDTMAIKIINRIEQVEERQKELETAIAKLRMEMEINGQN